MKVHKSVGSKDRFIEMFQGVNKIKKIRLNEDLIKNAQAKGNIVSLAFQGLVDGTLKVQNTNSQVKGNDSFVKIVAADDSTNVVTFSFKVASSQGDQDGVFGISDVKLIQMTIVGDGYDFDVPEASNVIIKLNNERKDEMTEIVSQYVDFETEEPEVDGLYEDAINTIDSITPDDNFALPTDYGDKTFGSDEEEIEEPNLEEPEADDQKEIEVTPEKRDIILQAYDNLVAKNGARNRNYSPTSDEVMAEIDRMGGKTKPAPKKIRTFDRIAEPWLDEEENSDYPDQIGKKFKPKSTYPKKKKKPQTTVKIGEGEELQGGLGDEKTEADFSPEQIKLGLKVEMEHSEDPNVALEIVFDHLTEDPTYYTTKEDPEASAQANASAEAEEFADPTKPQICDPMTDVLLGYKPKNVGDTVDEDMVGAVGATPAVGGSVDTTNDDEIATKKFGEYQKKDVNNLRDDEKEEYFELWKRFIGNNYE